jgi:hypothetical protein
MGSGFQCPVPRAGGATDWRRDLGRFVSTGKSRVQGTVNDLARLIVEGPRGELFESALKLPPFNFALYSREYVQ